jgi:hypothetical protein
MAKRVPSASLDATWMVASWARTTSLTMYSLRPSPSPLLLAPRRNGSNSVPSASLGRLALIADGQLYPVHRV